MARAYIKAGKDPIGPMMSFFMWDDPKLPMYYAQQGQIGRTNEVSDELMDMLYDKSALDTK
jgi:hypothetical protein